MLEPKRTTNRKQGRPGAAFAFAAALCVAGCGGPTDGAVAGGNPAQGAALIARLGCGSCHVIPGIAGADGLVGPPLAKIGVRTIIAGLLPNTPENLEAWIENPQAVVPGNAMPNMEVNKDEAKDIVAYLYTLR